MVNVGCDIAENDMVEFIGQSKKIGADDRSQKRGKV